MPANLLEQDLNWRPADFKSGALTTQLCFLFLHNSLGSAYEVKNNCCLFEKPIKVKKNGVSRFRISFFVLEIFMFLYYANEESDDVIGGST